MAIETTGKTIDAAINAALEQLQTDRDSVTVEVLENPKTGFLGIGGTPARVRVKLVGEKDEEPPKAAPPPSRKETAEKPKPLKKEEPKPAAQAAPKPAKAAPTAAQSNAASILKGILDRMGIPGTAITERNEDRYLMLEVSGANMGRLIGRRGETLDSVQRIVSAAANRGAADRRRIVVDAERYRAKREESLEALARSTAEKAVKYNRDMLLEPMNAYSRHVIHTALQDNPYVTTHSVGNEPQRRVIISLSGAKKTAPPRRENP
ncbi:MAG: Jag N-terminal domain-containing protein [Oscillospiraceae bacterium]|jgi:spoIIIJ-associated protein|nr:Jag N-terminal domain-containing protein [Oscillospiraceae bacterium]